MGKLWAEGLTADFEISPHSKVNFPSDVCDSDVSISCGDPVETCNHGNLEADISCDSQLQISRLLIVDPKERCTAKEALAHPFFKREEVSNAFFSFLWLFIFSNMKKCI